MGSLDWGLTSPMGPKPWGGERSDPYKVPNLKALLLLNQKELTRVSSHARLRPRRERQLWSQPPAPHRTGNATQRPSVPHKAREG